MPTTRKCSTPSCDGRVVSATLCRNCYSGVHYWMNKGVKAAMDHRHKLQVRSERMEFIRPQNVAHLAEQRRRRRG